MNELCIYSGNKSLSKKNYEGQVSDTTEVISETEDSQENR
jgi:hypothetical protein